MAGVELETGLKFSHVPFTGEPKMIAALLGGHIMSAIINNTSAISQIQAGTLRAVAVPQGDERLSAFPDIPTLKEVAKELGMKSTVLYPGLMMAAKKGTGPIVEKLANIFDQARRSSGFQKYAKIHFQDGMPLVGQSCRIILRKHTRISEKRSEAWDRKEIVKLRPAPPTAGRGEQAQGGAVRQSHSAGSWR
jgi:tripartite-type tricarboxylate transporter receptor subunit TctC